VTEDLTLDLYRDLVQRRDLWLLDAAMKREEARG
jgi:hypothetical protein